MINDEYEQNPYQLNSGHNITSFRKSLPFMEGDIIIYYFPIFVYNLFTDFVI